MDLIFLTAAFMVLSFRFVTTAGTGDQNWPKGYSVPHNVMLNNIIGRGEVFPKYALLRDWVCVVGGGKHLSLYHLLCVFSVSFAYSSVFISTHKFFLLLPFWFSPLSHCGGTEWVTRWGLTCWLGSTHHSRQDLCSKVDKSVGNQLPLVLLLPQL